MATNQWKEIANQYPHPDYQKYIAEPSFVYEADRIKDRILDRHRLLIETTGESFQYYRRKYAGTRCSCWSDTDQQPSGECVICYGTGFVGGYDLEAHHIKARFTMVPRRFAMGEQGFTIDQRPRIWTLPEPTIRVRDIIISVSQVGEDMQMTRSREAVTRAASGDDTLALTDVFEVISVTPRKASGGIFYTENVDYTIVNNNQIHWISTNCPAAGTTYFVTYSYNTVFTKRYELGEVFYSRMQNVTLHQEAYVKEIEPNNILYQIPYVPITDLKCPVLNYPNP